MTCADFLRRFLSLKMADADDADKVAAADRDADKVAAAAKWIEEADAVLVCAGAGMSAMAGEAVYVDEDDFAAHYPWMAQQATGRRTSACGWGRTIACRRGPSGGSGRRTT